VLRWVIPILIVAGLLLLWAKQRDKEQARAALAQVRAKDTPMDLAQTPPEQLLCGAESSSVCKGFERWKRAKDCAERRAALAEMKTAVAAMQSSPSFLKLADGVVAVETKTPPCR
jgi:hypothetical protein